MNDIVTALQAGKIIAYPTEAVYGLGCDPTNDEAITRLLQLKNRSFHKGLILIASHFEQLTPFISPIPAHRLVKIMATWPGPFTWVFPAEPHVSKLLRGNHTTLAVRVTNHPLAKSLCDRFGKPLVSTSANLEGQPPARDAATVKKIFGNRIDCIIAGEVGDLEHPTEIRDALTGELIRG